MVLTQATLSEGEDGEEEESRRPVLQTSDVVDGEHVTGYDFASTQSTALLVFLHTLLYFVPIASTTPDGMRVGSYTCALLSSVSFNSGHGC